VEQHRSHRLNRLSKLPHPVVPWDKPEVKVVGCVLVVEIVDVFYTKDVSLYFPNLVQEKDELLGFFYDHFIEGIEVALCGQDYQTRNGVCDVLVCMKVLRFQYCAAESAAPSCDNLATEAGC